MGADGDAVVDGGGLQVVEAGARLKTREYGAARIIGPFHPKSVSSTGGAINNSNNATNR